MRLFFFIPILFLFIACEIDTKESNRYEVLQLIDNGKFDLALDKLGNCNDSKGFSEEECHLNRGMSYFGLAGYDITSVGEELYKTYSDNETTSDEKSIKVIAILFDRFKGENIENGVSEYKLALNSSSVDKSVCNLTDFANLSTNQQQSCISINPILLLDIIDEAKVGDNLLSIDLQDLVDIEKSVRGIAPNISSEDMAYLLSNDLEKTSQNTQDEIDATQCLIIEDSCTAVGFRTAEKVGNYNNFEIWKLKKFNNSFTTLKLTDNDSVLLLEENSYITQKEVVCLEIDYQKYDGNCFPKPVKTDTTLTSNIVDKLNDDDNFRNSIALILNVGDDETSETEQVDQFMIDICDSSDCEVTEKNLIQYFNGAK